ncbi:MAG: hypothetical protein C0475_03230 [Planctomyces sp.]|nr:hypothetical protein [Planctomyces sp.]
MDAPLTDHHHSQGPAPSEPALRVPVLVVGRCAMARQLRKEPAVALYRVESAADALGELAHIPPASAQSPTPIVVIAPGAVPELATSGPDHADPDHDPDAERRLVDAMRRLRPDVRVLRLVDHPRGSDDGRRFGYDGAVLPGAGLDQLEAASWPDEAHSAVPAPAPELPLPAPRAPATHPAPGPHHAQAPQPVPPAAQAHPAPPPQSPLGAHAITDDRSLVDAVLAGSEDLPAHAVGVLQRRLGSTVHFFAARGPGVPADAAEVVHEGRPLGWLSIDGAAQPHAARAAEWLAAWLGLAQRHAELRSHAMTDPLTGAFNRRFFEHYLADALEDCRKSRTACAVLLLDIDNFKFFNDRFGHAAGDAILREVVKLLRSVIRTSDRVCRLGGDELAVIFYEPSSQRRASAKPLSSIVPIVQRFQRQIQSHRFPKLESAPGPLSLSGGLVTYPWDGRDARELLNRADELLLEGKREGKNRVKFGRDDDATL